MSLRHAVLGMLADEPGSGYDLLKRFERAMANVWPATQSQLYGELGKLEKAGLIHVHAEGPRGRKEYEITEAGLAELRHWLVEVEPSGPPRSAGLLRVYFLGSVSPEQARGYIATMAEQGEAREKRLAELEGTIDWGEDNQSLYGRLVLEWGKRFSAMQREWAEWAVKQIE
ncbi:PadR family transcriptional regulator [Amycolatopsis australiensis]|uniref:DNA-binding transcriptional regulator, PadR family n=1 Tax=Amycolatopsis australiensis TaxID=546364 RepID=A0A1K1RY21_9PSEU|nr:PadR family transcriptional regulator [Amycolatopsis australiensis]SFW76858.1 DNA-binding transcriptional regulator, PadR family [Amycolatopsis australiensis]